MCDWEWESFEGIMTGRSLSVVDAGPLHAPVRSLSLSRNEKLDLIMESVSEQTAKSNAVSYPLGTVRVNTDTVKLSNQFGAEITAHGVQPFSQNTSFNDDPALGEKKELSSVHSLTGTLRTNKNVAYVIDWLSNVSDSFLWSDLTDDVTDIVKTRKLYRYKGAEGTTLKWSSRSGGGSRNCVKLTVDDCELYLCTSRDTVTKVPKPGYILYIGNPSKEFREKVLNCLSFSLGNFLIYLGCSSFCDDWGLAAFEARDAYSLGGRAFEIPALPPAPLGMQYLREINPVMLSRMVNALYSHYDALKFGTLCWAYWHAVAATPHIAPVHFGAAIEALQRSYMEVNEGNVSTTLIDKIAFGTLRDTILDAINKLEVDDITKTILQNKAGGMNNPPHGVLTDRILATLQLELGDVEKKAWKRRDHAGHGNEIPSDKYTELIRETKLLRIRFNRILLAIVNGTDLYYDYYTLNHPVRKLRDPIM